MNEELLTQVVTAARRWTTTDDAGSWGDMHLLDSKGAEAIANLAQRRDQLEQVALTMYAALQVAGGYTTLPPKLLDRIDAALAAYRDYNGAQR